MAQLCLYKTVSYLPSRFAKTCSSEPICSVSFQTLPFRLKKSRRFSVMLIKGDKRSLWFAQVLLLFHVEQNTFQRDKEQFAFVRYFEVLTPVDKVKKLPFACLLGVLLTMKRIKHFIMSVQSVIEKRWESGTASFNILHYSLLNPLLDQLVLWHHFLRSYRGLLSSVTLIESRCKIKSQTSVDEWSTLLMLIMIHLSQV